MFSPPWLHFHEPVSQAGGSVVGRLASVLRGRSVEPATHRHIQRERVLSGARRGGGRRGEKSEAESQATGNRGARDERAGNIDSDAETERDRDDDERRRQTTTATKRTATTDWDDQKRTDDDGRERERETDRDRQRHKTDRGAKDEEGHREAETQPKVTQYLSSSSPPPPQPQPLLPLAHGFPIQTQRPQRDSGVTSPCFLTGNKQRVHSTDLRWLFPLFALEKAVPSSPPGTLLGS